MADEANAEDWADADVLIAPIGTAVPATENDPFDSDWISVGYLDGDTGFTHSREQTYKDTFAWGGKRIRRTAKNYMESVTWKSWEYNDTTRALLFPGSPAGVRKVPVAVPVLLALTKTTDGETRRLISSRHVLVDPTGEIKDVEGDVTGYTFVANVIADTDGDLWIEQPEFGEDAVTLVSIALSGATTAAVGGTGQVVATATYSDASTVDVTASAIWASATPAKATVPYGAGAVHGVASGTSVITARYGSIVSAGRTITVS